MTEQRGDARPLVFGSHVGAEWCAVQGKYGPITLWRWENHQTTAQLTLTRESAEALWRELSGFLGHDTTRADEAPHG